MKDDGDSRIRTGSVVLEARGLSKSYSGRVALRGVSLVVESGSVLGLVGPNGSGKTTLLNLISGYAKPEEVWEPGCRIYLGILGVPVSSFPAWRISRLGVGRSFQGIRLPAALSVRDALELPRGSGWDWVLETVGIDPRDHRRVGTLSFGQKKVVSVVCALKQGRRLVLLDEPFSGLAPAARSAVLKAIGLAAASGASVIVADHDFLALRQVCTRVMVLDHGAIAFDGTFPEIDSNGLLPLIFGTNRRTGTAKNATSS